MSTNEPTQTSDLSMSPPTAPVKPPQQAYHFDRSQLTVHKKIKGPGSDPEVNRQLGYNNRRRRWEEMVSTTQATFNNNTTCQKCGLALGQGKHVLSNGLDELREMVVARMGGVSLEESVDQTELDFWRDQWLDLEAIYWVDCGNVECC